MQLSVCVSLLTTDSASAALRLSELALHTTEVAVVTTIEITTTKNVENEAKA